MKKESTMFKYDQTTNSILDISAGFQKSRVLLTACELGVFDAIGEDFKTATEIAALTFTDAKALERLLNALVAIEMIQKKDGKYGNSVLSSRYLVKGNQDYMGNFAHLNQLWGSWSTLTDAVRTGTSVTLPHHHSDKKSTEDFINAMHWRATKQAPSVIKEIAPEKPAKILDLGGGSGAFAMEFVRFNPKLDLTIYDLPEVIEITQSYLEVKGFEGRINTFAGDFTQEKLPKNHYDMVFVSMVLHSFSFWENMEIMKNIYDTLRIGGKIVVHENLLDDNRTSPQNAAMFSLNMLVNTRSGDALTESELWILLKESWFTKFQKKDTEFGTSLIFGTK